MKHQVEFKGFEPTDSIRGLVEERMGRIEKRSGGLPVDAIVLWCVVEEMSAHKRYRVSITFEAPGKALSAREETGRLEAAIRGAFDALERQLEAYESRRRGEHWWKRVE